ncbi:MAG: GIY-YIG nuclease family protein [Clostridiales bacterium]|nr:GIY-YIG nuclease family protein [Clostridiales bacterium]
MYYTYILKCSDGSLYCGYTNDVDKRVAAHNAGNAAKYTKSRLPVLLAYQVCFETKTEAMKTEYAIKQLSRQEKLRLIDKSSEYKTVLNKQPVLLLRSK